MPITFCLKKNNEVSFDISGDARTLNGQCCDHLNCAKPVFNVRLFKLDSVTLKFSGFNWIHLAFNGFS